MAEYHVGNGICGIYAGILDKSGCKWRSKSDVTDEAIRAVFGWFASNMEDKEDNEGYSITYPSSEYELIMIKKEKEKNNNG